MRIILVLAIIASIFSQSLFASASYAPLCRELRREQLELYQMQNSIQDKVALQEDLKDYFEKNGVATSALALNIGFYIGAYFTLLRLAFTPAQISAGASEAISTASLGVHDLEGILGLIAIPFIPVIIVDVGQVRLYQLIYNQDIEKQETFGVQNSNIIENIKKYNQDFLLNDLSEKHAALKKWVSKSNNIIEKNFEPTSLAGHLLTAGFQESKRIQHKLELLKAQEAVIRSVINSHQRFVNSIVTIGVQEQLATRDYYDCLFAQTLTK